MPEARRLAPSPDPMGDATLYGYLLDGARRRILVAEDDVEMRRLLVQTLQRDGYTVTAVEDGESLLDALRAELDDPDPIDPFDLVVTDVRMPGWTGLDAVEMLRAHRCLTPVLVVTAFGDDMVHRRARSLEAAILDKPVEMHDLSRTVFDLLSRKPGWGQAPGFGDEDDDEDAGIYLIGWMPIRRRR